MWVVLVTRAIVHEGNDFSYFVWMVTISLTWRSYMRGQQLTLAQMHDFFSVLDISVRDCHVALADADAWDCNGADGSQCGRLVGSRLGWMPVR